MNEMTVAQGMVTSRVARGIPPKDAYDNVIQTLERERDELSAQDAALSRKLTAEGESPEYIKERLDAYAIEIQKQNRLINATRQLKQAKWTP